MIAVAENVLSSRAWLRNTRPVLLLLVLVGFCPCCFGQLPTDLSLPSETINSGSQVFQASNSITNSASFVVQDSASVTLAAGSSIRLEPGFDAVAGSAPFTFFAVIDPNVGQGPPNQGDGPPSIPGSYTAPAYSPTCDNISGQWIDSDNFGNSVGWDLNQNGSSITGTLSFDDYRGQTYCGRISYSASGVSNGNSYSLSAVNPVPSIDSCGFLLAPSETSTVTLSGQACGSGAGTYTISDGGPGPGIARANQTSSHAIVRKAVNASARLAVTSSASTSNPSVQPAATSGSSTWTTYTPRFNVSYSSYIPVDNIIGPSQCYFYPGGTPQQPLPYHLVYKGDAFRGTYRTTEAIFVVPDKQYYGNFFSNAGPTRNYGVGSPVNGNTLSSYPTSPDIYDGPYAGADEDSNRNDCHFWNDRGKDSVTNMDYHVIFIGSHQAQIGFSGLGQNPLEPQFGGITWNANITLNTADPSNPTADVSITHTCYPAHIVKVNGKPVYEYIPGPNNTFYVLGCLSGVGKITKTITGIGVPSY